MTKKFLSIAVTAAIISIVVGYIGAIIARPNAQKNLSDVPDRISQLVSVDKNSVHTNSSAQKQTTCTTSRCHGDMKTNKTPWHKMHLTISLVSFECQDCHKKVTTGPRTMKGKVNIDRGVCLKCHRQKFSAYSPQHTRSDWVRLHTTLPEVAKVKPKCFMCHNAQRKELFFCGQCHEKHEHSKNWIFGGHGKKARQVFDYVPRATRGPSEKQNIINRRFNVENSNINCMNCHEKKQWCTWRCHQGSVLPHNIPKWQKFWKDEPKAPKWINVHFKVAVKIGFEKCKRCHKFNSSKGDPTLVKTPFNKGWEKKEFCQQCHHKSFYKTMPGLNVPWATKEGGMAYVKKQGSVRCWKCHDVEFCVYCHAKNQKPPYIDFEKKKKSSNYQPQEVLFKEIENFTFISKPPTFYTYYNNEVPVEQLYPEYDKDGFFKRNIPNNKTDGLNR